MMISSETIDFNRQKNLDVDPKSIQQREFVKQLQNPDNAIVDNVDNPCFFNNFRKNQRKKAEILSRKRNSIIKDGEL